MKRTTLLRACRSLSLLLVLLAFRPAVVEAGTIFVEFALPFSYADLEFGPDLGFARIVDSPFLGFDDRLSSPDGEFDIVGGTLNLVTGPLIDVTPSGGDAVYTHAAGGSISIEFDLLLPDGSTHHGTFEALLGLYTILPDGVGGGGDTSGLLGAGLFDEGTATLLGINRHTLSGDASLFLDTSDVYPDTFRVAKAFGYLDVVAIPEPSLLLLIALGGGAAALRSRRRTRATAGERSN